MPAMKRTISRALGLLLVAACLLAAAHTASFALWPNDLRQPSLYIIEGYLDRAPQDAKIQDRIDITAHGRSRAMGRPAKPGSIATFRA